LGLLVGLVGGFGLSTVLESSDTRIRTARQAELLTNLPVLGTVSRGMLSADEIKNARVLGRSDHASEAFRLLGLSLAALQHQRSIRTIQITSPVPAQGKEIVATNLARAMAELGMKTLLVEADLRNLVIDGVFESKNGFSLSNLLTGSSKFQPAALDNLLTLAEPPNLYVINGGSKADNPAALLASPAMNGFIDYLRKQDDIALIDTPPVLNMSDASVLAPKMDGVIVVVRQSYINSDQVLAAIRQLQSCQAQILGLVFVNDK
jgi:capsular exopolysaccharide synthesis family protein